MRELNVALHHLYDPSYLRGSPLCELFDLVRSDDPALLLRQLLVSAIEALSPGTDVPTQSKAWIAFRVLFHRYTEQLTQKEVAIDVGMSVRQLRRQERLAQRALANYLWSRYDLGFKRNDEGASRYSLGEISSPDAGTPSCRDELEWLHQSIPSELVDVAELLQAVLKLADPLVRKQGVRIRSELEAYLPKALVQLTCVRQVLLTMLSAAIERVPGGQVHVQAKSQGRNIFVSMQSEACQAGPVAPLNYDVGKMEIAQQLIGLSGGSLAVIPGERAECLLSITLTLPTSQQVRVLVIDDNADTLQMLQRYAVGTHYHILGTRDAEEALTLAEKIVPHVVLLDIMLPRVDGWELLGRLRVHPKTHDIPVIVCTILQEQELALALGAAEFIRKPVSRNSLLMALGRQSGRLQRNPAEHLNTGQKLRHG